MLAVRLVHAHVPRVPRDQRDGTAPVAGCGFPARRIGAGADGDPSGRGHAPSTINVLVAYDGSESARRALERAIALVGPGDDVHVVGVAPTIRPGLRLDDPGYGRRANAVVEALEEVRTRLATCPATWQVTLRRGDAETILCEEAQAGYDLVVVGSRPLSGLERMLLGSVTSWIAHHATCDVVITR
jgi:nucleotide-binding universal stress UspA family protein